MWSTGKGKDFHFMLLMLLGLLVVSFTDPENQPVSTGEIIEGMVSATRGIEVVKYRMKRLERIDGEMNFQESTVSVCRKPFSVYTRQLKPKEGIEALYNTKDLEGKAVVNPNGFPWINLYLDPYSKIMRRKQHHVIMNSGYDYMISILEHIQRKYGDRIDDFIDYSGEITWSNRVCDVLVFENPEFGFTDHTVREGESLVSIAAERKISDYMILSRNKKIKDYGDIDPGDIISIPSDYCKSMVIYIEKESGLPVYFNIHDDKGLFEQYEFFDVVVNPAIKPGEFTEKFEEYGF